MANYAISDGTKIVNVIVAKSKKIAEELTGMTAIETSGNPWIDWTLEEDGWRSPSPYPSWLWSGEEWVSPVPIPTEGGFIYTWNEDELRWDAEEILPPFPSWIKDEFGNWISPVPYPQGETLHVWDENIQNWVLPEPSEEQ